MHVIVCIYLDAAPCHDAQNMLCHHCYPSLVTCVTLVSARVLTHHLSRKH